ncbi:hypothetical protein [Burkholderia pseudomallei]|uniref:hypothetical protein n=1 Tax=Burkholderia pseudomallei TaxID=28450 RepID=UPI0004F8B318|nr:hypothetical protein [Burkholderia pseudomallei]AIP11225.1 hypothetical protein DP55_3228 [Burkholderia pseudomallei]AJX85609.1 hypothetical protein BH02_55 [Burkholderia pseudomallei]KGC49088.1 hypothetical protein DO66_4942 [Burkholderia pseudomallei]MBM5577844.1 hypothetical protein [Burkholderia pseudomallei]CAJ2750239.1 Uncharacterised protein [Burkholderia pseudomallei]
MSSMHQSAHTQLVRARIAFSHGGLCGEHGWLASPDRKKVDARKVFAGKDVDRMSSFEIAMCMSSDMEDRMLALATELDELESKYAALDAAMNASDIAREAA